MSRNARIFLPACFLLLVLLWLPGLRFPVVSDSIHYGLLGRSLWEHGTYVLDGAPYANHLPLHAFLSYPFTQTLGFHLGMHVTSLMGGFLTLIGVFFLTQQSLKSQLLACAITLSVVLHPAFVLMAMLGSADLLFCGLFLLSLYFFLRAEKNRQMYLLAGLCAGLSTITRYNGLPLFLLFFGWTAWKRPLHLKNIWFWIGMILGCAIFGGWLLRNYVAFGNPLHSGYTGELAQEAPNPFEQIFQNILYYGNPLHNVFPFFFVFALWGLFKNFRKHLFLVLAMIAGAMISAIWWVQAIRFMFPAFVLLLFFSILGIQDVLHRCHPEPFGSAQGKLRRRTITAFLILVGLATQSFFFCLYTYGQCNALLDRMLPIPPNLGLTPEGFYAWHLARNYINKNAEPEAVILYEFPEESKGIFRSDLRVSDEKISCPFYRITQKPEERENVVFKTEAEPITYVVKQECVR